MSKFTIKGKLLSECSDEEIAKEYDAGIQIDASEGLTKEQYEKILAIEKEIDSRPNYGKEFNI